MNAFERIAAALAGIRQATVDEKELQAMMAGAFAASGIRFDREVATGFGIIDFVVDGHVGVEVKTDGSWVRVFRQISCYLRCERLTEGIVVTTKPIEFPTDHVETVQGRKPLRVVPLWKQFL